TFTETTAAFNAYAKGSLTLTGDKGHVVRIPVVVQPVRIQAPAEVSGTGTTSSLTYNVKAGFAGALGFPTVGLQAATKFDDTVSGDTACTFDTANPDASVAKGTATVDTFTTPADAKLIRFASAGVVNVSTV